MKKKVKDLTEEEVQAVCDYFGHDCDNCILAVSYDRVCMPWASEESRDWKTIMRESIRCSRSSKPGSSTLVDIVIYTDDKGETQYCYCDSEQEAQKRCEELRKAFDEKFKGLLD